MFFLEHAGELRTIILRRKKGKNLTKHTPTHTKDLNDIHAFSRTMHNLYPSLTKVWHKGREVPNNSSPDQNPEVHSSLVSKRALAKFGVTASNTHLLRWFHRDQAPRITRELRPFRIWSLELAVILSHQSSKHSFEFHFFCSI